MDLEGGRPVDFRRAVERGWYHSNTRFGRLSGWYCGRVRIDGFGRFCRWCALADGSSELLRADRLKYQDRAYTRREDSDHDGH